MLTLSAIETELILTTAFTLGLCDLAVLDTVNLHWDLARMRGTRGWRRRIVRAAIGSARLMRLLGRTGHTHRRLKLVPPPSLNLEVMHLIVHLDDEGNPFIKSARLSFLEKLDLQIMFQATVELTDGVLFRPVHILETLNKLVRIRSR